MNLIQNLVTAIRYFTSLDPYHRDVDNRPLNDLGTNQDVLISGLDTEILSQKVLSMAAGFVARGMLGQGKAVGKVTYSGWTLRVLRLLAVHQRDASGTDARQIPGVSLWPEQLTASGTAEGVVTVGQHATLYNIYSIRANVGGAMTVKMPYYDGSALFPSISEVSQVSFSVTSSSKVSAPVAGDWASLPAVGSSQIEILRVVVPPISLGVLAGVVSSMVTAVNYVEEGAMASSSGGGSSGDYLLLDRAKQYGMSNTPSASGDNLVLISPLPDTDLNSVTEAGRYGVPEAQISSLTNSPMTQHTAQIGTWVSAFVDVLPVDATLIQVMQATRVINREGSSDPYLSREVWVRAKYAASWSSWQAEVLSPMAPLEIYDVAADVTRTIHRPAGRKVKMLMIGAGGGGGGGGSYFTNGYIPAGGLGGASGALLQVEVEINRDVVPEEEWEISVGRTSLAGASVEYASTTAKGYDGADGKDTVWKIGPHAIVVPGGQAGKAATLAHHAYSEAVLITSTVTNPVGMRWDGSDWQFMSTQAGTMHRSTGDTWDPGYVAHRLKWPVFKPYYASSLYTQTSTAQEDYSRHSPMVLKPGSVVDLWDTYGIRIRVLNSVPTLRAYMYPYAGTGVKYAYASDGKSGGVVHPSIPLSAYEGYLVFDPFSASELAHYLFADWDTFFEYYFQEEGKVNMVARRGGTRQFLMAMGTRVGEDFVVGMGISGLPARGGYAGTGGIAYGDTGVQLPNQETTNGIGMGAHAPATAWGCGGGGGASSVADDSPTPSSGHYYVGEDAGIDASGNLMTGNPTNDFQRAYPGGRGAAGYVSIIPE